ncbi:MAG: alpha/beta hydrolase [Pseudolabrys sp.]
MTIDLEAEYNNRARVPEHPAILAQLDIDAAAYRAASPLAQIGLKYGPLQRQVIDLFPGNAGMGDAPLAMFIHGGYWRTNHWSSYSHIAKQLNARGVDVAIVGYDLCPLVTVAAIIDEMRAACLFLWRKRRQRLMVFGHSAGGHLAACMAATDWTRIESDAPADLVPAGYSISGLFDLAPMTKVSMNAELRLDDAEARRVSPLFWNVPPGRVFDAVVGGAESDEFRRQSRLVADTWSGKAQTRYGEIAGANHFTVIGPLKDPDSAMVKRLVELAQAAA